MACRHAQTHWFGPSLILAILVAICSEVARMRDRQHELAAQLTASADRDPLTGVYNRRWSARLLPQAIELAERICQQVASDWFEPPGHPPRHITVSFGITQLEPGGHADQLMSRADRGLYLAKQQGRNRVSYAAA